MAKINRTEYLKQLERKLADQGKLIEAGWIGYQLAAINAEASELQLSETRMAFFAGAQHLFTSILIIMDDDREPTDKDLDRMQLIHQELEDFIGDFSRKHGLSGVQ
jgi:hypothetical protein